MNDVDKDTRETYNKIASNWASQYSDISLRKRERKDFESFVKKGALILDAGCGAGRDASCFIRDGYEVIGIDYSSVEILS